MTDIDIAIRTALAMPAGYEPVQRVPLTTRLAVKMNTGGCSDNAVERAEHLPFGYVPQFHELSLVKGCMPWFLQAARGTGRALNLLLLHAS